MHAGGAFLVIAPPMYCLDVVWMVVSPCPSHAFAPLVVRDNIAVIGELVLTDWANSFLLGYLPIEQLPHLSP
jgi:hypothetical protein